VGDVLGTVNEFIGGTVDSLGEAVSGVTPGGSDSAPNDG
jgi:hypothetical protein